MYSVFGTLSWITPYGLMLVAALFSCWLYARRRAPAFGVGQSHVDLAVPLIFAISLLGAEVISLFDPRDTQFAGEILQTHTRFRLFGLLLTGVPVLYVYSRLANLSFRKLLDLFALPALLWLAVLRIGCFMAGCCWGDLTIKYPALETLNPALSMQVLTVPWLSGDWLPFTVSFPTGSLAYQQHQALGLIGPAANSALPVHPSQLYELALLAVLLVVFRRVEINRLPEGMLSLYALGAYCLIRFFIEFVRADNVLLLESLTFHQLICVALLVACIVGVPIMKRAG